MMMDGKRRVVLVEDDALFQDLVRLSLTHSGQVEVVGTFTDGESALARVPALKPDVALLDIELRGEMTGVQLGRMLRREQPGIGIVLLSHHRLPAFLSAVPPNEIAGWSYLLKGSTQNVATLLRAIEGAATGDIVLDRHLLPNAQSGHGGRLNLLTPRQQEILRLMAEGFNNQGIAEQLVLARKTVENQINAIYQALAIDPADGAMQPRVQAVLIYLRESRLI